jgi:rubrerythrin
MKQKLLITAFLVAGSLSFIACNNAEENKSDMKTPVETKETGEKVDSTSSLSKEDAAVKTIADMQAAFKGETNATARYAAFSKKAAAEGYTEIAMLFKAASMSENVHANNHKAVLEEMGVTVSPVTLDVVVNTTKENLEFSIKGEAYEVAEMYPSFLKDANIAENQLALISLNYAYKTEKKHKVYYEKALAALNSNTVKTLPTVYYICPTCGNTYETAAPKRCGISMTGGEKFVKINSL